MFNFLGPLLKFLSKLMHLGSTVKRKKEQEQQEDERKKTEQEIKEDPMGWFNDGFSSKTKQEDIQEKNDEPNS
jgi:hypothetical protein